MRTQRKEHFSITAHGDVRYHNHSGKQLGRFEKMLSRIIVHDSAIPCLGIYRKENACLHKNKNVHISEYHYSKWKQLKCQSNEKHINKTQYVYKMEYFFRVIK